MQKSGNCGHWSQMREEDTSSAFWWVLNPGSGLLLCSSPGPHALSCFLITWSLWHKHLLPSRTCPFGSTSVTMITVNSVCSTLTRSLSCKSHYERCDVSFAAYGHMASFESDNLIPASRIKSSLASFTAAWEDWIDLKFSKDLYLNTLLSCTNFI